MANPRNGAEIHPALTEALRVDRDSLNARFALRQRAGAKIDESAFQRHLQTTVNDLVSGVARVRAERVRAVVNALFDVSLDLFAAGLLGPNARHPHVNAAWRIVLPKATILLARDPLRVAGCLSNAVDHLAAQSGARPDEWLEFMSQVSPHCDSVSQWLDVGKVIAWRAGLVQYRSAALKLVREMPWKLATRCFDAQDGLTESQWNQQLDRMEADYWYSPGSVKPEATTSLRIVRTTGGFRGFGGPCLRPPTVRADGEWLFVSDGIATWKLLADTFGTLWQRVSMTPEKFTAFGAVSKTAIDSRGRVSWDKMDQVFDELADANSFACDGKTLAVTLPTSHHVFLVARAAN